MAFRDTRNKTFQLETKLDTHLTNVVCWRLRSLTYSVWLKSHIHMVWSEHINKSLWLATSLTQTDDFVGLSRVCLRYITEVKLWLISIPLLYRQHTVLPSLYKDLIKFWWFLLRTHKNLQFIHCCMNNYKHIYTVFGM